MKERDLSEWVTVGFVSGAGNSSSLKSYSFTHNHDGYWGKFFYRLKQIDMDGSYKYSNEVEVQILPEISFWDRIILIHLILLRKLVAQFLV